MATLGLFAYKSKNPELGKRLYKRTINEFDKLKGRYSVQSAFLNYFNEQIHYTTTKSEMKKLEKELIAMIPENAENDIIYRKK